MSYSLMLTLLAAEIGFVAGFWFCVGSAFTSTKTIAELATSYWDYNKQHADVVIAQSAQYAVGAPLLILAFALQVLVAVLPSSSANVDWLPIQLSTPLMFLVAFLIPCWLLSFIAYRCLLYVRGKRVHALLLKRQVESE